MTLTRISDHVAAWDSPGGQSNATIISGSDHVACIDALMSPAAAAELDAAVIGWVGRPVDLLVLTHHHADHVFGAGGFSAAPLVIAHRRVRDILHAAGTSERQRLIDAIPALAPQLDGVAAPVPSLTMDAALDLHLGGVDVHLRAVGPAHTPGDVVAHVPADGVLATGDLAFAGFHPVLRDADVAGWQHALARVHDLDAAYVVPGHGRIGDGAILEAMASYLDQLLDVARQSRAAGWGPDEAAERIGLRDFASWERPDRVPQSIARALLATSPT